MAWLLFFTRCDVFCYSTHIQKNVCTVIIYLFYTMKIQMVYWKILRAWKKKNKFADVDFSPSVLTWIWRHLCVCPLIDHCQQPMKMHTEVQLLYNIKWNIFRRIMSSWKSKIWVKTRWKYNETVSYFRLVLTRILGFQDDIILQNIFYFIFLQVAGHSNSGNCARGKLRSQKVLRARLLLSNLLL